MNRSVSIYIQYDQYSKLAANIELTKQIINITYDRRKNFTLLIEQRRRALQKVPLGSRRRLANNDRTKRIQVTNKGFAILFFIFQEQIDQPIIRVENKKFLGIFYFMKKKIVENILAIMYGIAISIERTEVSAYYQLSQLFKFDWLLKQLLNDMQLYLEEYDIFCVIKIAHYGQHKNLLKLCMNELEKEEFEQLKYHQMHLLGLQQDLFKIIVKANNTFRATQKKGLSYKRMNQIMRVYCEFNGLADETFEDMKIEMFDISSLSSSDFQQIFYHYFCNSNFHQSTTSFPSTSDESICKSANSLKTNLRVIKFGDVILQKDSFELKLFIENTLLKKKNIELQKQNKDLIQEVNELISLCNNNKSLGEEIESSLSDSKQFLQKDARYQVKLVTEAINIMNKDFDQKISEIEQMFNHLSGNQKSRCKTNVQQNQRKLLIVSNTLNEIFINTLPVIQDNQLQKLSEFSQNFVIPPILELPSKKKTINRISFNEPPISVSQKHISFLSQIVTKNSFKKKFFQIIYRRCKDSVSKGSKNSLVNRGNLLVLIKTKSQIQMGGYITARIPNEKITQLADKGAFIFNLNKNRKYLVRGSEKRRSLKFIEDKLLCFGDDLQIPQQCLQKKGVCGGPQIYGDDQTREVSEGGKWIYGKPEFEIDSLEIYQVIEDDMQMVLL